MATEFIELPNGIRIIVEPLSYTRLAYVSFVFDVGSRDESPQETGLAHFTEHMLFKGTQSRRSWHILNRIDSVGGELNAYTTKEKTNYYAVVLKEHTARAFDLLTDIAFRSVFPEKEVARERQVIEEEIEMYADNPEESILEDFDQLMYIEQAIGSPILGTKEALKNYTSADFVSFTGKHYTGKNLVVSIAGNFTKRQFDLLISKFLEPLKFETNENSLRVSPVLSTPISLTKAKSIQQMHSVWGGRACSFHDDDYLPLLVINYLLGGPAMNNRLNLNIREKYGLTYNLYSYINAFVDTGIWGIYAGYDPANHSRIDKLIRKELSGLIAQALTERQLLALKKQFLGYLVLGNENPISRISGQAKDLLDLGRMFQLDESLALIEQLTVEQIHEVGTKYLNSDSISILSYYPAIDSKSETTSDS